MALALSTIRHVPEARSQTRILCGGRGIVAGVSLRRSGQGEEGRRTDVSSYDPVRSVDPCSASAVTKLSCPRSTRMSCARPAAQLRSRKWRLLYVSNLGRPSRRGESARGGVKRGGRGETDQRDGSEGAGGGTGSEEVRTSEWYRHRSGVWTSARHLGET